MLSLLSWFATVIGIVTGFIALAEFMFKRIHAAPQTQRRWLTIICISITASMFIFAAFFSHLSAMSATHTPSNRIATSTHPPATPTVIPTTNTSNTFTSGYTPIAYPTPTVHPTPAASPTATAFPIVSLTGTPPSSGTLLYKADWSGGMDGWHGGTEWKTAQNMLLSDGSNCCGGTESIIVAPLLLNNITDYEVKARIQFIRADSLCSGYSFGLMARMDNNLNGYEGTDNLAYGACDLTQGKASIVVDNYTQLASASFVPDTSWHTYQIIVQGDQITLSIDDQQILTTVDNTLLGGGKVGIEDFNVQINVSDFEVIAQ